MGYRIELRDSDFHLPANKADDALKAIKEWVKNTPHISWVNNNVVLGATSLEEAMKEFRWTIFRNPDTNVFDVIEFDGEKLGEDEILLNTIAPFVEKESFLEISGEDGAIWRWIFNGDSIKEEFAVINWR